MGCQKRKTALVSWLSIIIKLNNSPNIKTIYMQ